MKKAKFISAICAAAILTGTLAGCGGSSSGTNSTATGDSGNSKLPTLTYWTIGSATDNLEKALKNINEYAAEKIGANLKVNISNWGDWDTKMNTIVNSGEAFDLMFTNNTKYTSQVNLGAFADLTEMVQSETPDLYSLIPEAVWAGTKIDDKIYAVPTYKDSAAAQYWVFDDKYVQKYNLDVASITTFDALYDALKTIKEGEGSLYPLQYSNEGFNGIFGCYGGYDDLTVGLPAMGVKLDDTTHKVVSVLEQEEKVNQFRILHKMYTEGLINPDAATTKEAPKNLPFLSAQGFPGAEITWQINNGVEKYDTVKVDGPRYSTGSIQGSMNAISKNSKLQKEALKYLQLANTDSKLRNMMAYGVEGEDFTYVDGKDNKVVKKISDNWNWPSYTQATFFNLATVDGAPEDQWDQVKKLNEEATNSASLGFAMDITPVQNEVANCKTVWDQYKYEMNTGTSDPDEKIPEILAKLKDAGFDKVMTEAQKQIDAYFAQ